MVFRCGSVVQLIRLIGRVFVAIYCRCLLSWQAYQACIWYACMQVFGQCSNLVYAEVLGFTLYYAWYAWCAWNHHFQLSRVGHLRQLSRVGIFPQLSIEAIAE